MMKIKILLTSFVVTAGLLMTGVSAWAAAPHKPADQKMTATQQFLACQGVTLKLLKRALKETPQIRVDDKETVLKKPIQLWGQNITRLTMTYNPDAMESYWTYKLPISMAAVKRHMGLSDEICPPSLGECDAWINEGGRWLKPINGGNAVQITCSLEL